jgi:hypothetical protein
MGVGVAISPLFGKLAVPDWDPTRPTTEGGILVYSWYDFGDPGQLYQDAAKITPVSSDGDPIGAVLDQGRNGQDLTQSTASKKPTYKTGIQDGLSAGRGDGSDDILEGHQVSMTFSGELTLCLVLVINTLGRAFVGHDWNYRIYADSNGAVHWKMGADVTLTANGVVSTAWGLLVITRDDSDNLACRYNGSDVTSGTPSNSSNAIMEDLFRAGNSLDGDIGEVLVFDAALSAADLAEVEGYLAERWGLSLGS